MTTSGTYNFDLIVNDMIEEAYSRIGGEYMSGTDASEARRSLNLLLLEIMNKGAPFSQLELDSFTTTDGTDSYDLDPEVEAVIDVVVRRDDTDFPLERLSLMEYFNLPSKVQSEGRPTAYATDRDRDGIKIYLWPVPDNSTDIVRFYGLQRIEDVTSSRQHIDISHRYLPALAAGLAYKLSFKRQGIPIEDRSLLRREYLELLNDAFGEDRERSEMVVVPGF